MTNAYINSTLTVILFAVLAFFIRRSISDVPKGLQNFFEMIIESLLGFFDQVTGDRKKSLKFFPLIGTIFLFIVVSNWIGILPGVGTIGVYHLVHGQVELVPIFRSANSDLNLTLAMAVGAVVLSHVIGIATIGFFKYFNKFVKLGDIWLAIKSKKLINVLVAFIEFGVGLLEVISEVAKMLSLSLRLFGNVFAGEVLLTVMAGLIAYFVPLPFIGLELLVGIVQATVFSMLVLVYISIAVTPVTAHNANQAH